MQGKKKKKKSGHTTARGIILQRPFRQNSEHEEIQSH